MRPKQVKEAIRINLSCNINTLLVGAPAIGKTQVAEQTAAEYCAEHGGAYMVLHPVCDDPADWKGLGFPSSDKTSAAFLPYGNLLTMINATAPLIVIIDDVGQAMVSVQAALMQVLEHHSINGKHISEHCRFILCTNRRGDKAGVSGIIEPLKSRCLPINFDVNGDDWRLWANQNGLPVELIAFSKLRENLLFDFTPTTDIVNSSSPRGFARVGTLQNAGIPKSIEFEMYQGCVGAKAATEYVAFLDRFRSMPNPEKYIKNPDNEPLPSEESILYALAAALSGMANKTNLEAIYKVAMRLDAEFSTFLVFSMIQRDKKLSQNVHMAAWAKKYATYLLD